MYDEGDASVFLNMGILCKLLLRGLLLIFLFLTLKFFSYTSFAANLRKVTIG